MRKLFTIVLCLVAIHPFAQIRVGLEAGFNYATFGKAKSTQLTNDWPRASFQGGIVGEMKLTNSFFLLSGLLFTEYGKESSAYIPSYAPEGNEQRYVTTKVAYLQLPVALGYRLHGMKNFVPFIAGGLYVARGLAGSNKGWNIVYITRATSYSINEKAKFTNGNDVEEGQFSVNPYDFGAQISTGFDWYPFQLSVKYLQGLINTTPYYSNGPYKNQSLSVSLSYWLGH